jgi:hypothetical protein
VALLASIFGGPDVLASEWRTHLAARLLAAPAGFDADAHVRTLELLRARFGDGGLGGAEVMLKDVADSRRLAAAVAALPAAAVHRSPPRRGAGGAGAVSAPALADGTTAGGAGGVGRLSVLVTSATYWPRARHPEAGLAYKDFWGGRDAVLALHFPSERERKKVSQAFDELHYAALREMDSLGADVILVGTRLAF